MIVLRFGTLCHFGALLKRGCQMARTVSDMSNLVLLSGERVYAVLKGPPAMTAFAYLSGS